MNLLLSCVVDGYLVVVLLREHHSDLVEVIDCVDELLRTVPLCELDSCGCVVDEGVRVLLFESIEEVDGIGAGEAVDDGGASVAAVSHVLELLERPIEGACLASHDTNV